ncbi:MAG: hypothetical protein QOE77_3463 [Blastocatellia bacterium]|nr:hypothetical protein [Blastocatellia bacterium]
MAARCSVRGKHSGDSLGFKATHSPIDFTGMSIIRVKEGKFVEAWNNFDFLQMYQQLGQQLQMS